MRFAALGDSVTVGLGDPQPCGGWRGWATYLADSLTVPAEGSGRVELTNLASCGALVRDVAAEQLPRALSVRPALASVLVGVNDTLRGRFDLDMIAADLEEIVVRLRHVGAFVLTAGLPDPGLMLKLPELLRRPLSRRVRAVNSILDDLARRHGTVHIDLTVRPAVYDRRMWGIDPLHPSERGHRLLARVFATELAERGVPLAALPDPEPTNPPPTAAARTYWMATKGTKWLFKRSYDLLPQLIQMAMAEWWHEVRGGTAMRDALVRAEVEDALRGLPADPPGILDRVGD
ncbi:MAG: SGNH/GDSL hydrolase family protein [Streptosporangiales bacterium]|nr:SGNH/GDSL hydrolase family protein [Streptosporangiales bacterium]